MIDTVTRLELMFHISEIHRSSWTGRLIASSMLNTGLHIRGMLPDFKNASLDSLLEKNRLNNKISLYSNRYCSDDFSNDNEGRHDFTLILYPGAESVSFYETIENIYKFNYINSFSFRVLIPDGTWNQASRMLKRENLFRKALEKQNTRTVYIRPEPVHRMREFLKKDHVATVEAVIHILPYIEKDGKAKADQLLSHYHRLFEAVRKSSGR